MEIGIERILHWAIAWIGAGLAMIFDVSFGPVFTALVVLMGLDLVTALIANGKLQRLDPMVGWLGWRKKSTTVVLVLAIKILKELGEAAYPNIDNIPAAAFIAAGFCMMELMSIVRNASLCGVVIPKPIADLFKSQLK